MEKKTVQPPAPEAQAAPEKDLTAAKQAFEAAVAKTNGEPKAAAEEEVASVDYVKPAKEKAEPKTKKVEKPSEIEALKAEVAKLTERLTPKEKPAEKPKQSADFEAAQAELAEHFGEEEGQILGKVLKGLLAPREERIASLESMIQRAIESTNKKAGKSNRARLSKDYPHLAENDRAWQAIENEAKRLASDGEYDSPEDAFDDVVQALYGEVKAKAEEDAEEQASRIAASTMTQPSSAKRERKPTKEQKALAVFNHLLKNPDDIGGARRAAEGR
mgnify:CR=1 FL=1